MVRDATGLHWRRKSPRAAPGTQRNRANDRWQRYIVPGGQHCRLTLCPLPKTSFITNPRTLALDLLLLCVPVVHPQ